MKKRFVILVTLSLILSIGLSAQKPFFMNKEGPSLTFENKDAKKKVTGYSITTVTKVEGDAANGTVSYESMVLDAKKKPLLTKPFAVNIKIENGVVQLDPASFAGTLSEGMQVSGGSMMLPSNLSVGDTFEDYTVNVAIGPIKTTSAFSGIKVVANETLDIAGTSIECFVIESIVSSKVIGIKSETTQKTWYARNIGVAKQETYDKKGKIFTTQELISIEGL